MTEPIAQADPIYPELSTEPSAPEYPGEPAAIDDEREKRQKELELAKIEEEISTLRQVLTSKEQQAALLRKDLGITTFGQIKAELNKVQSSQAYKKTQETLKSAGQATAGVFNTISSSMSTKFSEMKNSPTFKSFEERVEGVGTSIMAKVSGVPREGNSSAASTPQEAEPVTKQPQQADEVPM